MTLDFTKNENANFTLLWKTILLIFLPLIAVWMLYNSWSQIGMLAKKKRAVRLLNAVMIIRNP